MDTYLNEISDKTECRRSEKPSTTRLDTHSSGSYSRLSAVRPPLPVLLLVAVNTPLQTHYTNARVEARRSMLGGPCTFQPPAQQNRMIATKSTVRAAPSEDHAEIRIDHAPTESVNRPAAIPSSHAATHNAKSCRCHAAVREPTRMQTQT